MCSKSITVNSQSEEWYDWVLKNDIKQAQRLAHSLLEKGVEDENGCIVSDTEHPRKVRYRGNQDRAYRFIFYVLNEKVPNDDEVVRHLCHNKCCMNPNHLALGERSDNRDDDRLREAYGVDFDWL